MKRVCPCGTEFDTKCNRKYCSDECTKVAKKLSRQGHYSRHKESVKQKAHAYYHGNKSKVSVSARYYRAKNKQIMVSRKLEYKFGLTLEQAKEKLGNQGGCCDICRKPLDYATGVKGRDGPSIDHNHKTGKIRGIICMCCNTGLGMFTDNTATLREAANYLERYN